MMKRIMPLCALVCALAFSVSCKKDSADNNGWKVIPSEIITAESGNAAITVNAVPVQIGSNIYAANLLNYYSYQPIEASSAARRQTTRGPKRPNRRSPPAALLPRRWQFCRSMSVFF